MSKFLKVIVNIFLVLAILIAAAILVPPLVGIKTTIVDSEAIRTNLPMGSITYSRDISAADLKAGDRILKEDGSQVYSYRMTSGDPASGTVKAVSTTDSSAAETDLTVRGMISKIVITLPLIGYVVVAMHSMEGIIIVGLVVILMIILFILSELWKPVSDDEEEDEEEEEDGNAENDGRGYVQPEVDRESFQEMNQEEATAASVAEILKENASRGEEEKADVSAGASVRAATQEMPDIAAAAAAAALAASVDAQDGQTAVAAQNGPAEAEESGTENAGAAEEPEVKEPAAADAEAQDAASTAGGQEYVTQENAAPAVAEESAEPDAVPAEEPEIVLDDPDAFIPITRPAVETLLEEAQQAGEKVKVLRDETTGVTLVDWSDLL